MLCFGQGIFVVSVLVANVGVSHYSDKLQHGGWRDHRVWLHKGSLSETILLLEVKGADRPKILVVNCLGDLAHFS